MLNQHEVGAHNHKVALKTSDRLLSKLEETLSTKPATRSHIPMCKPEDRAPRKIFKGALKGPRHHHNVPAASRIGGNVSSVMRDMVATPNKAVQGITSFARAERVTQNVIDMELVAKYLAK